MKTVKGSLSSAIACNFPMYVLPFEDVLRMESIGMHAHLMREGVLVEREIGMNVLFISQCWLSRSNPDRNNMKRNVLKHLLAAMTEGIVKFLACFSYELPLGRHEITGKELQDFTRGGHLWFDFFSIPQTNAEHMGLPVSSIPYYICEADMFVVLQPPAQHENQVYSTCGHKAAGDGAEWSGRSTHFPRSRSRFSSSNLAMNGLSRPRVIVLYPVGTGNFTLEGDCALLGPVLDMRLSSASCSRWNVTTCCATGCCGCPGPCSWSGPACPANRRCHSKRGWGR
jgi:hypothetical protein